MKVSNYVKIISANSLYSITGETDGYIKEKNGSKYLTLVYTDKIKEKLINYTELWGKIKTINGEAGEYGKD